MPLFLFRGVGVIFRRDGSNGYAGGLFFRITCRPVVETHAATCKANSESRGTSLGAGAEESADVADRGGGGDCAGIDCVSDGADDAVVVSAAGSEFAAGDRYAGHR